MVIPAFNTSHRVLRVLASLPDAVDLAIVVDDASRDDTAALLSGVCDPRVVVLRHAENRGVGGAIATGYHHALARDAALVAVMAGDAQMHPDDLVALAMPVVRGEADYAKGNRLVHPSCLRVMPLSRYLGNQALSLLTRYATGLRDISDSQCGYTVIARRVLEALDIDRLWSRYGYPNHLLGVLAREGFRVTDVTVRPVYADERSGVRLRDAVITVPRILAAVALGRTALAARPTVLGLPMNLRRSTL
ncbi:MAG: glycosyltransferase family 2 protein [Myxococcales bacterium]|nr:glycosyltransferase family 2 protein [Myxococcales bacterium]